MLRQAPHLCILHWQPHSQRLGRCSAIISCITVVLTPVLHLVNPQNTPYHAPNSNPMHLLLLLLLVMLMRPHVRLMLEVHQAIRMLLVLMDAQS